MKKSVLFTAILIIFSYSSMAQDVLLTINSKPKFIDLNSFDPNTIESVTVQKDKSAIESYDKTGKNGVIIFKTNDSDGERVFKPAPLIIVDGEKFYYAIITDGKKNLGINSIDRSDIKSILVMKDQTATKVFGETGKNGAIVIVTRSQK